MLLSCLIILGPLLAASRVCSIGDGCLPVCLNIVKLFRSLLLLQFCQFSWNFAHSTKDTVDHIFAIFGEFYKFQIWTLSVEQQQWNYVGGQASLEFPSFVANVTVHYIVMFHICDKLLCHLCLCSSVLRWNIQQWVQTTRYRESVMMISNGWTWRMPSSAEPRGKTESTAKDEQPVKGSSNL